MKAARYHRYGASSVIQIEDIPLPKLNAHEVLIKVVAAGVNPKDILIRKGKFKRLDGGNFPKQLGFDVAGVVEQSSPGSAFKVGESVFGMRNGWQGQTCAEYVILAEHELYGLPKPLSFEAAAGVPLAGQTALQAIRDKGKLKPKQTICINGASGGVGTFAIQIAKALGGEVTAISSHRNIALCSSLGADHVHDYTQKKITDSKRRFDVFFDVFGNYSYRKISKLLTPKGIYVTTVPSSTIIKEQLWNLFRGKKAKLVVVKSKSTDLAWLAEKLTSQEIKPVVDTVFSLADIQQAHTYIETKRAKGKVIISIA